ncbi:MAG: response regulator transcription factor [Eubacteriales bacterium]|nr:response regulator transcription factor [Eubacteriales bacterium]MDY3760663.1 response regulator transcription factor [Eubacteriales bacterium]
MIFCVEDDKSIRDLVIYTLTAVGYEAEGFATGEEMFKALEKTSPQLIMLDIMLPDEDGLAILKKLKSDPMTEDIPVIMATAKGTEYDKVVGLDLGADDYLAKPFGMMEMISRVKAVLRRSAPKEKTDLLRMGKLELDEKRHTVSVDGTQIQLTLKEYELLRVFMKNPGIVFSRDSLLSIVWGINFIGESRTVDVHIGTLRTKIGECGNYIETVRGVGYKMEEQK